jgi:hypothetical protein
MKSVNRLVSMKYREKTKQDKGKIPITGNQAK